MSFPKAKRFTEHASQGPGPNAYDVVFTGSDRLVRDHLQFSTLSAVKSNVFFKKFKVKSNGKKSEVQRVLDFTFF